MHKELCADRSWCCEPSRGPIQRIYNICISLYGSKFTPTHHVSFVNRIICKPPHMKWSLMAVGTYNHHIRICKLEWVAASPIRISNLHHAITIAVRCGVQVRPTALVHLLEQFYSGTTQTWFYIVYENITVILSSSAVNFDAQSWDSFASITNTVRGWSIWSLKGVRI